MIFLSHHWDTCCHVAYTCLRCLFLGLQKKTASIYACHYNKMLINIEIYWSCWFIRASSTWTCAAKVDDLFVCVLPLTGRCSDPISCTRQCFLPSPWPWHKRRQVPNLLIPSSSLSLLLCPMNSGASSSPIYRIWESVMHQLINSYRLTILHCFWKNQHMHTQIKSKIKHIQLCLQCHHWGSCHPFSYGLRQKRPPS